MSSESDNWDNIGGLMRDLDEVDTFEDFMDRELFDLHQYFVDPVLVCSVRKDILPPCKSGTELPLLPGCFSGDNGQLLNIQTARETAIRSAEQILDHWDGYHLKTIEHSSVRISDWRLGFPHSGRPTFLRIINQKQDPNQQTRAYVYFDVPPQNTGVLAPQRASRIGRFIKRLYDR